MRRSVREPAAATSGIIPRAGPGANAERRSPADRGTPRYTTADDAPVRDHRAAILDGPCSVMPVEGTSTHAIERVSFSAAHRSDRRTGAPNAVAPEHTPR